ncbi:hypothetical protein CEXT_777321 [Caerostris extrusa]|uniref:Secreted protein n=1 Tax=Caerostris extrusa TaxID=172846 RepID=A0AAV4Q3L1_CAEEX|nr:hypothetical protein CEXT_777321 [Caerostris extrusa]
MLIERAYLSILVTAQWACLQASLSCSWVSFDFSKAKLCWVLGAGRMFARWVFNMQPNICWCGGGSWVGLHVLGGVGGGIELSPLDAMGGRSVIENLINVIARIR